MTHTVTGFKIIFSRQLDASIPTHWAYPRAAQDTASIMTILNGVLRTVRQVNASNFEDLQGIFSARVDGLIPGSTQAYITSVSQESEAPGEINAKWIRTGTTQISEIMARRAKEAFAWAGVSVREF